MKRIIATASILIATSNLSAQQLAGQLKSKTKQVASKSMETKSESTPGKSASKEESKTMEGTWKVDGVIVTTEMEAMKSQLRTQEKQYNDAYKGSVWVFKKDGTISITLPKSESSPGGTGTYEIQSEKVAMEINGQPNMYDLKFEDGQMLLINVSALNTVYYVFVK